MTFLHWRGEIPNSVANSLISGAPRLKEPAKRPRISVTCSAVSLLLPLASPNEPGVPFGAPGVPADGMMLMFVIASIFFLFKVCSLSLSDIDFLHGPTAYNQLFKQLELGSSVEGLGFCDAVARLT